MTGALAVAGGVVGLLLGPWLATTTVRLARRDPSARAAPRRVAVTALLAAGAVAAAPVLTGARPAVVALGWFGAAAVVLAGVDLAVHRLPRRVVLPAVAGCALALAVDAAVTGDGDALLLALGGAAVSWGLATLARLVHPRSLGGGDVQLLGLLGLVLGWSGWGVLATGVFLGFLAGAVGSLLLVALGRAGWRTAVPFGPPLLVGAYAALALAAPLPMA
ncbi:prepilin peptidase [Modestobacter versicolor]|uniref:prepilin peptidase n=1 Tax=Modestobacter versicolor TaxID=429133 RepID=UPI0034DE4C9F